MLDAATNAFEWRLELDADAAAASRCRASDAEGFERAFDWSGLDAAVGHVPITLRAAAIHGHLVSAGVTTTIVLGWLCSVAPCAMSIAFAFSGTDAVDVLNGALAGCYLAAACAAAVAVFAATRPRSDETSPPWQTAACSVWLQIYAFVMRSLGWAMTACAAIAVWKLGLDAREGAAPVAIDTLLVVAVASCAVVYFRAGVGTRRAASRIVAAAGCDACRLWVMAWLLRASGVLPFFDDTEALGRAMTEHGDLVMNAFTQMLIDEPEWAIGIFAACAASSALIAVAVLSSWRVVPSTSSSPSR